MTRRPGRRYRLVGPVPLEARTVPTAMMMMPLMTAPPPPPEVTVTYTAPRPVVTSPWPYLSPMDRTPVRLLPDRATVTPLSYWSQLYGLGQIRLSQDRADATLAAMVADVEAMEANPGPMHDASVLFMSAMISEQMSEIQRLNGLRAWWASLPVSDPYPGVTP